MDNPPEVATKQRHDRGALKSGYQSGEEAR
ncbi:hypothetical protein AF72_05075 [Xylella taiwanensis]|uniref:Uncharacterized protein n=1 Tax=Xylella taiwanensis TaxID=1444770 RepID=Z9JLF5_9GAMM|nr:hypothetical protein AF72_05075 [Xylella taiwanensis]